MTRLAAGGVRSIRVQLYWPAIEPSAGASYDWRSFDGVVSDAARAGVQVLPLLYESPAWASDRPASPPIHTSIGRAAWSRFASALAARYGTAGTFWTLHPELPRLPITTWQLWNEVNLRFWWGSRPSPRGYGRFVKLTSRALEGSDPHARVLLAGLIPYKTVGAGSVPGDKYLARFLKIKGIKRHFAAVAIHPYASRPRVLLKAIREQRRQLQMLDVAKPLWATELGWSTGGDGWSTSPLRATLTGQAERVQKTYRLLRRNADRFGLARAFYFSFEDSTVTDSWLGQMGLFDAGGQPKPAWFAYARAAGGTP